MREKAVELVFKPVKPSSVHSGAEKSDAWEEYRANQQATLDRMARQREARLNAADLVRRKNGQP